MKKQLTLFFALALLFALPFSSKAQMYDKGSLTINPGISFGVIGSYGGLGYRGSNLNGFLPLTANLEYSVNDKFAIGPYLGYYSRGSKDNWRYTVLTFGARGTFHASDVINDALDVDINSEKLDIYATALLGLENYNYKWEYSGYGDNVTDSYLRLGIVVGTRYMFTPGVGAFIELGRGALGYSTLGMTFKLK